jgi:GNAT superfamily N-acetyltransferase
LPKALRGAGLGSRILAAAEEEGRKRGCRAAVLYTISFQAPDFYKRHGWRVFGEIPCDPPGTSRIFMTKELRP